MQDIQNVNPDEQFVPEGEDDDDSNSVISSRTSETNPIRSVWEMTEDDVRTIPCRTSRLGKRFES